MKRRGFLGVLFGAPVVAVAGKAIADAGSKFPKGLLESEPKPAAVAKAMNHSAHWDICCTCVVSDLQFDVYNENRLFERAKG